jgi:biopolymer transport protein ExbD
MSAPAHGEEDGGFGIVGINVTPLVDVTLVLLVIFMVTARLIASPAIPMELPRAGTAGAVQTTFTVTITPDGDVTADGCTVDDAGLKSAARAEQARDPNLRTVIAASRRTPHGEVVRVLDALRDVGVTRVAFAAERTP